MQDRISQLEEIVREKEQEMEEMIVSKEKDVKELNEQFQQRIVDEGARFK